MWGPYMHSKPSNQGCPSLVPKFDRIGAALSDGNGEERRDREGEKERVTFLAGVKEKGTSGEELPLVQEEEGEAAGSETSKEMEFIGG